jgi:hypothetical protein
MRRPSRTNILQSSWPEMRIKKVVAPSLKIWSFLDGENVDIDFLSCDAV